ncbi:hypothetical protein Q3G72_007271 [Acer saccharum]|nr:hypothetical protein Q3G72_007271 [Acer saccharum]
MVCDSNPTSSELIGDLSRILLLNFAKFLLRRRHYPISAVNLPTDTIVASPSVRCSSTRNGVIVEATKAARSSDPVRMGSSAAEATTGRSKAAATVAVRWWWRLWQQGQRNSSLPLGVAHN